MIFLLELDICNASKLSILTTNKYDVIFGLWDTTAAGNSTLAAPGSGVGKYNAEYPPRNILDQDTKSTYSSFGSCPYGTVSISCGIRTGFIVTPRQAVSLLLAIRFSTSVDMPASDPLTITIEGSNASSSTLILGDRWSLIYNGSSGLDVDPGRSTNGVVQCITNNTIWYTSYPVLVTSKRGSSYSVQYSMLRLYGYGIPNEGKSSFIYEDSLECAFENVLSCTYIYIYI